LRTPSSWYSNARHLTEAVPILATRVIQGSGKHAQTTKATSRVLGLMAVEGLLARGRPSGSWTTRQYEWHRRDQWLPLDDVLPTAEVASVSLVDRYLARFGPVTLTDIQWWTGWTKTKTRSALTATNAVEALLDDGSIGYVLPDDTTQVEQPEPWVTLLPSLDPTPMGYKEREWYVGDHVADLFDRNGNIGPTVWADGRIVGVWAQTASGDLATQLFEKLSADQHRLLEQRLERLRVFIGDTIVKPSFPTPLQKAISAGT